MPYSYEFAKPTGCIAVSWEGALSVSEFKAFLDEIAEDSEFEPGQPRLHVLRNITKHVSSAEVRLLTTAIEKMAGVHGERRVAILADEDLPFGISRMFSGQSIRSKDEILVTRDADKAKAYVGLADNYTLPADR